VSLSKAARFSKRGMPRFEELSNVQLANLRQYLRSQAMDLATNETATQEEPIRPLNRGWRWRTAATGPLAAD